jgi:hypothetical protein
MDKALADQTSTEHMLSTNLRMNSTPSHLTGNVGPARGHGTSRQVRTAPAWSGLWTDS